jgi:hypothetical protein
MCILALYYVTFQCGCLIIFRKIKKKKKLPTKSLKKHLKKLKKPTQKVSYLWQLRGFFSLQPRLPKTAQNFISVL